jgi:hypothetical protein
MNYLTSILLFILFTPMSSKYLSHSQGRRNDVKARGGGHVFYLLDDRGVREFSARRLCYS